MRLLLAAVVAIYLTILSCVLPLKKDPTCSSSLGSAVYNHDSEFLVKGEVRDRSGAPLQDVKVTISSKSGHETRCTYTNADGTWQLVLSKSGIAFSVTFEKADYSGLELFDLDLMKFPFLPATLVAFNDKGASWV